MIYICGVCGSEKNYDDYHRMYRRCDLCKTKHALKYYYSNKKHELGEKKNHYHKNKEVFSEQNKKRKSKISDLENQIITLTELLKNTISIS